MEPFPINWEIKVTYNHDLPGRDRMPTHKSVAVDELGARNEVLRFSGETLDSLARKGINFEDHDAFTLAHAVNEVVHDRFLEACPYEWDMPDVRPLVVLISDLLAHDGIPADAPGRGEDPWRAA